MATYDTTIKVGIDVDTSGGASLKRTMDDVAQSAKRAAQQKPGKGITASIREATSAVRTFRRVLIGFGSFGLFNLVSRNIGKLIESFRAGKREAEALARAAKMEQTAAAVKLLEKSYRDLTTALAEANAETARRDKLLDSQLAMSRRIQDAESNAAEAREIAAVDQKDPAASEKIAAIRAKYSTARAVLNADRAQEDVSREVRRQKAAADQKVSDAQKIYDTLPELDEQIAQARARLAQAQKTAKGKNAEDIDLGTFGGQVKSLGVNLGRITKLEWGKVGDERTESGDKVRAKAKEDAEREQARLEKLEAERRARVESARKLTTEADYLVEQAKVSGSALKAVNIEREASVLGAKTNQTAADRALGKKESQIAADEATIAQGPRRIAELQKKIAAAEAQRSSAISADSKEQMDAEMARQALASFDAAGYRRNGTGVQARRGALEADVERETAEANQSRAQLQATLATLAATLKGLNADLKKVEREVDAAVRRQNAVNEENPPA